MAQPVYRYHRSPNCLFINLIENFSCLSNCQFCGRPRTEAERVGQSNYYEREMGSLYLDESPKVDDVIKAVAANIKDSDRTISFTGLGEPLLYFNKLLQITKKLKEILPHLEVKLITSGMVELDNEYIVKGLKDAGLDVIYLSLNAINEIDYNRICKPQINDAFNKLLDLIKQCNSSITETYVSFVVGFSEIDISRQTKQYYIDFANKLGIDEDHIVWRPYRY